MSDLTDWQKLQQCMTDIAVLQQAVPLSTLHRSLSSLSQSVDVNEMANHASLVERCRGTVDSLSARGYLLVRRRAPDQAEEFQRWTTLLIEEFDDLTSTQPSGFEVPDTHNFTRSLSTIKEYLDDLKIQPQEGAEEFIADAVRELRLVADQSLEDIGRSFFVSYENYVSRYNAVLVGLKSRGLASVPPINPVPADEKGIGGVSDEEKAKLREACNAARSLQQKLEGMVTRPRSPESGIARIERICDKFHSVVMQLSKRHAGRPPLVIKDEYDVQDLLHALLRVDFTDIRPEEWTPSFAGASSRMDFFLPDDSMVVETKMTNEKSTAKTIGDELLLDIDRYKQRSDATTLACLVYDPGCRIANPRGVESDLRSHSKKIAVKVYIRPKHE